MLTASSTYSRLVLNDRFWHPRGLPGHSLPLSIAPQKRSRVAIVSCRWLAVFSVVRDQPKVHHRHFSVRMHREIIRFKGYLRIVGRADIDIVQNVGLVTVKPVARV